MRDNVSVMYAMRRIIRDELEQMPDDPELLSLINGIMGLIDLYLRRVEQLEELNK